MPGRGKWVVIEIPGDAVGGNVLVYNLNSSVYKHSKGPNRVDGWSARSVGYNARYSL